ncbi:MAG: RNA-binding S4 domain-containing protein [Odoribacter splanchnicus]|nr:RNA-binding S4 domain-containing protein [Odoribacter splanchnicus]
MEERVRIDKWLWAVRIFKTRSLAAEECGKGHVTIGDVHVKASRELKGGEVVKVRIAPIERHYLVKKLTDKRMSAQLAVDFVEDVTPPETLALLNAVKAYGFEYRDRGAGRPTKRDRRMIDKLKSEDWEGEE